MKCWFIDSEGEKPATRGVIQPRIVKAVAAEIATLLSYGKTGNATLGNRVVQAADIAILVRSNREARQCRDALAALNVPAVLHSAESVFSSREALEMERFLLAVHHPERDDLLLAALATDMIGCDLRCLHDLKADACKWEQWQDKFLHCRELMERSGLLRMFRFFIDREGVRQRLLLFADGERRLTNLLHLAEALQSAAEEQHMALDVLLTWFAGKIQNPGGEEHQLRLETDSAAVEIATIHKSKGLQYSIVFCPFAWEGYRKPEGALFYHENGGGLVCDLGSDEYQSHLRQAEKELLAEEIRLFYVALTRAVSCCIFVWGRINLSEKSAPAYLFHGGEGESGDVPTITTNYTELSSEAVRARMEEIAETSHGAIELLTMPDGAETSALPASSAGITLSCRQFGRTLDRAWQVTSFSQLSQYSDWEVEDLPQVRLFDHTDNQDESDPVLNFPPGPSSGVLLHEILEKCDFTKGGDPILSEFIAARLRGNGFDPALQAVVLEMINRVVNHPLKIMNFSAVSANIHSCIPDVSGNLFQDVRVDASAYESRVTAAGQVIYLANIANNQRLNELEFYFPLKNISPGRLRDIFVESGVFAPSLLPDDFLLSLKRLQFNPLRGFMRGFMDMVFQTEGRWYLVDWKSNLLGKKRHDYSRERLPAVMVEHQYILQCYIYLMALHTYLRLRDPGYDYNLHFGGVFYLFLRGMNPAWGSDCGVYFDRPDLERVEFLCREFIAGD
jgi:exodeoxyribonuclease V beta subunit